MRHHTSAPNPHPHYAIIHRPPIPPPTIIFFISPRSLPSFLYFLPCLASTTPSLYLLLLFEGLAGPVQGAAVVCVRRPLFTLIMGIGSVLFGFQATSTGTSLNQSPKRRVMRGQTTSSRHVIFILWMMVLFRQKHAVKQGKFCCYVATVCDGQVVSMTCTQVLSQIKPGCSKDYPLQLHPIVPLWSLLTHPDLFIWDVLWVFSSTWNNWGGVYDLNLGSSPRGNHDILALILEFFPVAHVCFRVYDLNKPILRQT